MSETKPGVSFAFSSKKKHDNVKLTQSKLLDTTQETREETDFVKTVEHNKINGSIKKAPKKELVIPLITKNRWRTPGNDTKTENTEASDLDKQAEKEILQETLKAVDGWENRGNGVPSNIDIPLFMQNRVPSGFETDEKVDVSLRADQSTLDDYEAIPVEAYGMAMLRGMGWKASEGIGLSRKGVAAPMEVKLRPKGLGLGADRTVLENAAKALTKPKEGEEELKVIIGANVQLLSGKHQGLYGQVLSMDANTGRALVRMAVGSNELEMSELFLKPVSAKEYRDSARILNKEKYDEYKTKQDKERNEKERNDRESRKKRKHSRSPSHRSRRSGSRERRDEKKESRSKNRSSKGSDEKREPWLHPLLRVRCVDSSFKDGQFYKQKMVVVDVISKNHCICKAENGKLLENVNISKLETVIPRSDPAYVMVVKGKRKGQVCQVIERDKERYTATVQILPDRDEVFQLDYDDICEYTGDVRNL
ncbi:G-patch domain and KOW motifs-containing protein-like [Daphnia pulicaria]|uniref:G-patch domain and KOW motifs-containing protein-like n=1 Tax=Daphnia pulicaria TaxID=35523 RepID=UPI001EEB273C|nr:G-patch domain and KOW motifs-containing protein-like [Daphnia pulicaria]